MEGIGIRCGDQETDSSSHSRRTHAGAPKNSGANCRWYRTSTTVINYTFTHRLYLGAHCCPFHASPIYASVLITTRLHLPWSPLLIGGGHPVTAPYSVLLRPGTLVSGSFLLCSFERLDTRFALQHKNKSGSQKCTPLCGVPWIKSLRLIAEGFSISKTMLGQLMPKHQHCLIVQRAGKRH